MPGSFLESTGGSVFESAEVQAAADDLFPRKTSEFAGADTSFPVVAIVVREEDGRRRLEENGPEQQFQFLRTILREPSDGLWLRS